MNAPTVTEMFAAIREAEAIDKHWYADSHGVALRAAADLLTRMAAVCGPECPKCGRFLFAEHTVYRNGIDSSPWEVSRNRYDAGETISSVPCFDTQGLRDHPDIAAALGLAPEVTGG